MNIINTIAEMVTTSMTLRMQGNTIGCVPTMGALHDGHGSLIRASAQQHTVTVVSVFVNPTQFGPNEDYQRYPRTLDSDTALAEQFGATHLFVPSVNDMYPTGSSTTVSVGSLSTILEGAVRPGHFDGVATIVAKLLNAIQPTAAFFGQKDYQQTLVIKKMVGDLNFPVEINVQPTIRDSDGLAMSSRNRYLSASERSKAVAIYRALQAGEERVKGGERFRTHIEHAMMIELSDLHVDYVLAADAGTLATPEAFDPGDTVVLLIAARLGATRLIDNITVRLR